MATLVLTAAGAAVGGPIGAAVGSAVGQYIDRNVLFAPKRREGPRLTELRLQLSSYGTQIPHLFGTMRVAGTVIWATDLQETRSVAHAGKGQPSIAEYSYSASFAVLLSARPIRAVGRIWAEGKLLRGAAGDWKAPTAFRLHPGGEDQAVDPLIAGAVGAALAPAHRGCAYAVFEGLQLADYGNRIPSLTFEVVADDGPVGIGDIAAALAPEVTGEAAVTVEGFAATGSSVRAVLETLGQIGGGWFAADGRQLVWRDGGGDAAAITDSGVAAAEGARRSRSTASIETVPRTLAVSHYDPARDYQTGVQRARRPGAGSRAEQVEMPAVLTAIDAKGIAEAMLMRAEVERTTRVVALGLEGLAIGPGQRVTVSGEAGIWRVTNAAAEGLVTRLTLVRIAGAPVAVAGADSGRVLGAADEMAGTTLLDAFETPALDDAVLSSPRLTIVAAGTGAGWRRAALLYSLDGGASWLPAGPSAAPAVMGRIVAGPGNGPSTLADEIATLVVELAHAGMELTDADDRQLDGGANLAMAGGELIQFGRAEPLGVGRWRLSRLWRGRRGTEAMIGMQAAGDRFVLLEAETARTIDLPLAAMGTSVRVIASGVGDADGPATATALITGASVLPPAPVALAGKRENGLKLRWRRRSRAGWRWLDGVEVPLAEEAERYRVTLAGDGGVSRAIEVTEPALALAAAELPPGLLTGSVRQLGTFGESPGTTIGVDAGSGEEG